MQILSNIFAFIFALGVIVFVHEAGHYLVAKVMGVRVLTFSLGFGRRIWSIQPRETEYRVSWIPLGGYVNFAGQDPAERSDDPRDYLNKPRWQRVLILLAGPAMNVVLAVVLVAIVLVSGPTVADPPPILGAVDGGMAGERAGLKTADRILAIDGSQVDNWQEVMFSVLTSAGRPLEIEYERDGRTRNTRLTPEKSMPDEIGEAGIHPVVMVGEVVEGGAADSAGVLFGDAVLSIDGVAIRDFGELRDQIIDRLGETLVLDILRQDRRLQVSVTPRLVDGQAMIGVAQALRHFTVAEALVESVRFNADLTVQILALVKKIFERRISLRASLGGPIQIAAVSGAAARSGFLPLLGFMAFISINLFIFNLFPIPILDGGQILILLVEVTLRHDLSLRIKERVTQVGLVMIVMLMAMAIYFDLSRSLASVLAPQGSSETEEAQPED